MFTFFILFFYFEVYNVIQTETKILFLMGIAVSEWKFAIVRECSETDGFSIPVVGYKAEEGESISQNDLLLLSKTKVPTRFI